MRTLAACVALILLPTALLANAAPEISRFLERSLAGLPACSEERIAIEATISRLKKTALPERGKFVLVNIPGGFLTAYDNGKPQFEMHTIVGKVDHPTPETSTKITEVRFNPTWTVPASIIRAENWHKLLREDPEFFRRNGFEFRDAGNNLLGFEEARKNPGKIAKWIQAPGPLNALGLFRFNIQNSNDIYLHHTRDPENFYDDSPLTLSHGCVRLEYPDKFAQWLLDWPASEVESIKRDGSSIDIRLEKPVNIVMGYFTAWPAANGEIMIFDDIYRKENRERCKS